MLHRCKKCSNNLKVASVGGGEVANLAACHFSHFQFLLCHQRSLLKCHCTFYIYGPLIKKAMFRFFKQALVIELSARISWRTFEGQCLHILHNKTAIAWFFHNLNVALDVKSVVTFLKWPLLAELKLKMWKMTGFQIFTLDATFEMLLKLSHVRSIGQKGFLSDFEKIVY